MQRPQPAPQPISEYYLPESLRDITTQLSEPELNHHRDREKVNILVVNLVVKYLAAYLEVFATTPEGVQAGIRQKIREMKTGAEGRSFMVESFEQAFMIGGGPIGTKSDRFGVESLIDTGATAAIAKEIMFNRDFDTQSPEFLGVDLGSGTGILTLATIIAGQRSQAKKVEVIGFEKSSDAVRKSNALLKQLIDQDRSNALIINGDILDHRLHQAYGQYKPHMWVSETITTHTPLMDVSTMGVQMPAEAATDIFMAQNIQMDPFPAVVDIAIRTTPEMYGRIRSGQTAMFPDVINGLYRPNGDHGSIYLKTGGRPRTKLNQIGQEFDTSFQPIVDHSTAKRFPVVDADMEEMLRMLEKLGSRMSGLL